MQYRPFGQTGLSVSTLGLTLAPTPFSLLSGTSAQSSLQSIDIEPNLSPEPLWRALIEGVTLVSVSRQSPESERLLGQVLRKHQRDVVVVSQSALLDSAMTTEELRKTLKNSLELSRRTMDRETIEVWELPLLTVPLLQQECIADFLYYARHQEWIRFFAIQPVDEKALEFGLQQPHWDVISTHWAWFGPQAEEWVELATRRPVAVTQALYSLDELLSSSASASSRLQNLAKRLSRSQALWQTKTLSTSESTIIFTLAHPLIQAGWFAPYQVIPWFTRHKFLDLPQWSQAQWLEALKALEQNQPDQLQAVSSLLHYQETVS